MLPQSPSALGIEVLTTLHDLWPFVFCLYGVQVHCPCALEARSHPFPAVRAPVMSPTTKITAEEAFIWRSIPPSNGRYGNHHRWKHCLKLP